ncbi:hypothetical protein [Streptomyces sp. NBC_01794]|uniref:hypothetical protein n=1 Tax=Streptomyces sp. NBC_01794 TaxID=2975942 RepID=UPI00308DFE3D|nr:hypothetical protein OIE54_24635 [Streptomyces sp. NBC_01794]
MPAHPTPPGEPEIDATAVFSPAAVGAAEYGYGARYAEDSFDYPSPAPEQSWSAGAQPPDIAQPDSSAESDGVDGGQRRADRAGAHPAGRWRQVTVRRRPALLVAAVLVAMGGVGIALSIVSDTLSSTPVPGAPGDTAQVSAPKSPTAPSSPPDATASASSPESGGSGAAPAPTGTSLPPGAAGQRDDERGEDQRDEHEREDGDGADDG